MSVATDMRNLAKAARDEADRQVDDRRNKAANVIKAATGLAELKNRIKGA